MNVTPLGSKLIVKLLPRYEAEENKLQLKIVDKQRHYEGTRKGEVVNVGPNVREISVGDIVVFRGDLGTSFGLGAESFNDGVEYRELMETEIDAVELGVV